MRIVFFAERALTDSRVYGNIAIVKTTIDIPEALYRQAKTRAVQESTSLKKILLRALERELRSSTSEESPPQVPYFARRKLLPAFKRLQKSGAFAPRPRDRDITDLISEDREDRSS